MPTSNKDYCKQFASPAGKIDLYVIDYSKNYIVPTDGQDFAGLYFYTNDNIPIALPAFTAKVTSGVFDIVAESGNEADKWGVLETEQLSSTKFRILYMTNTYSSIDNCVARWNTGLLAGEIKDSVGSISESGNVHVDINSKWTLTHLMTNESRAVFAIEVEWTHVSSAGVFTDWTLISGSGGGGNSGNLANLTATAVTLGSGSPASALYTPRN